MDALHGSSSRQDWTDPPSAQIMLFVVDCLSIISLNLLSRYTSSLTRKFTATCLQAWCRSSIMPHVLIAFPRSRWPPCSKFHVPRMCLAASLIDACQAVNTQWMNNFWPTSEATVRLLARKKRSHTSRYLIITSVRCSWYRNSIHIGYLSNLTPLQR